MPKRRLDWMCNFDYGMKASDLMINCSLAGSQRTAVLKLLKCALADLPYCGVAGSGPLRCCRLAAVQAERDAGRQASDQGAINWVRAPAGAAALSSALQRCPGVLTVPVRARIRSPGTPRIRSLGTPASLNCISRSARQAERPHCPHSGAGAGAGAGDGAGAAACGSGFKV